MAYAQDNLTSRSEEVTMPTAGGGTQVETITEQFTYDAAGRMKTHTDPLGIISRNTYDPATGNLTETRQVGNPSDGTDDIVAQNVYGAGGVLTQTTDPTGTVTKFGYSAEGFPLSTRLDMPPAGDGPEDLVTTTQPDAMGRPTKQFDARGFETDFTYDAAGRIKKTTALGNPADPGDDVVTENFYDAAGRLFKTKDPLGHERMTIYDAVNRATEQHEPDGAASKFEYDNEGRRTKTTDPLNRATRSEYDALERATKTIFADGSERRQEYDALGRVVRSFDERGNKTEFEYDEMGRTVLVRDAMGHETRTEYDKVGRRVAVVDALGHRTEFAYDAFGRQTRTTFPDQAFKLTIYDKRGRVVMEQDANGRQTNFDYDDAGRLIGVTDARNATWHHEYDKTGDRTAQIDPLNRRTEWTYDEQGRKKTRKLPLGQIESFAYNADGRVTTQSRFDGTLVTHQYDAMDREMERTFDGGFARNGYDLAGQRTGMEDGHGATGYQYDARGRVIRVNHPTNEAISYRYDPAGNRIAVFTLDDGTTQTAQNMTYDELNRLKTVDTVQGTWSYDYDDAGRKSHLHAPNNTRTDCEYDALNRITRVHTVKIWLAPSYHETDLLDLNYQMDNVGNRTKVTEKLGGITIAETTYGYDETYRLMDETRTETEAYTRQYTYDAVGNRLTQTTNIGGNIETRTYAYDANDRLTAETVSGLGAILYSYDENGNLTRKEHPAEGITLYSWNGDGRLITVSPQFSPAIQFAYDADGNRVSKTIGSQITRYLVDVSNGTGYSQVVRESDQSDNEIVRYTYGDDLLTQFRSGASSYYNYDAVGSTRALTNALGDQTDTYSYRGFGELLATSGTTSNGYLFGGEQFDANLGSYYLRARYLDTSIGRFVSMDPLGGSIRDRLAHNKYLYANANPTSRLDPSGQLTLGEFVTGFSIQAVLARAAVGASLGAVDAAFRCYSITSGAVTGALGGVVGPLVPLKVGLAFGAYGVIEAAWHGAYASALFRAATLGFCYFMQTKGFKSFDEFKEVYGPAGAGKQWHHIVEQNKTNIARFGPEALHTPSNIAPIPGGAGSVHAKISGFYSSKQPNLTNSETLTVREWLTAKSFEDQYQFGLETLARFSNQVPLNPFDSTTSWLWPATISTFAEDPAPEES